MFILIKNTNFGYNSFLVDSIYVSNTIEEAREKAFKIIKEQYIEDCMEECGYIEGNEEPEIVNYEDNDDESKAQFMEKIFGSNGDKKESLLLAENTEKFENRMKF